MSASYENGRAELRLLLERYGALADRNEATTRLQLIDSLFFDCLGWAREDCIAEESHGGEYADYTFLAPTRALIVEAKREGDYFEVPLGLNAVEYRLQSLMRDNHGLSAAVRQVAGYCQSRGVLFGAVANGHQLVAFIAVRHDLPPLEGRAVVFPSLQFMEDHFLELWNALSKPAVMERQLRTTLAGSPTPALPPKLSASIPGYPGTKARNGFQADLQILSELVLEDLTGSPELENLFLRECYCESGALSEYSLLSRDLLQARYSALFDETVPGPTTAPAVQKGGKVSPELLAESLSRRPILIIGDVGVGKTTFLRNLMKVDAAEQFANAIAIHINLGEQGALAVDLKAFIVGEIERQLREEYGIDVEEDGIVRAAYNGDLQRFSRGIFGRLKESSPQAYAQEEIKFLAQKVADRPEHLRYTLEHVAKGRKKQVVIFLDNADQRDFETQQQAFLIAQEFATRWPAMVFLTLRPETFHQSMRAEGALSGYHPKAFTIAPPRIDRVLERRISFALKITSGEISVPQLEEIKVNLGSLDSVLRALLHTLNESSEIGELVDNVAAGNVRLALDLVRSFLGSGHVDTEKIATIHRNSGRYLIPLHEFLRAVVYGDYAHFDPTRSYFANLFDISSEDGKEHFLLPLLVGELAGWRGPGVQNGFVETARVYEFLQGLGYTPEQVDHAIVRGHRHRLIEAAGRRTPKEGLEMPPSLRATPVGVYHIQRLAGLFAYIDAIVVDTSVLQRSVRERISDAHSVVERLARAAVFVEYLDSQWIPLSGGTTAFDWAPVSRALSNDMQRASAGHQKNLQRNSVNVDVVR